MPLMSTTMAVDPRFANQTLRWYRCVAWPHLCLSSAVMSASSLRAVPVSSDISSPPEQSINSSTTPAPGAKHDYWLFSQHECHCMKLKLCSCISPSTPCVTTAQLRSLFDQHWRRCGCRDQHATRPPNRHSCHVLCSRSHLVLCGAVPVQMLPQGP